MRRELQHGVSLVEILVSLAVLGVLLAIAVPNFQLFIQNTQIRTGAEAVMNGLQTARNEAIRRNASVQLKLVGGTGWAVNTKMNPDLVPPLFQRLHEEGSQNAVPAMLPAGATTVTFNALGRVDTNADASPAIAQIDIDNPSMPAADSRELRIVIPLGGAVRMCDPQVAAGDPRAC